MGNAQSVGRRREYGELGEETPGPAHTPRPRQSSVDLTRKRDKPVFGVSLGYGEAPSRKMTQVRESDVPVFSDKKVCAGGGKAPARGDSGKAPANGDNKAPPASGDGGKAPPASGDNKAPPACTAPRCTHPWSWRDDVPELPAADQARRRELLATRCYATHGARPYHGPSETAATRALDAFALDTAAVDRPLWAGTIRRVVVRRVAPDDSAQGAIMLLWYADKSPVALAGVDGYEFGEVMRAFGVFCTLHGSRAALTPADGHTQLRVEVHKRVHGHWDSYLDGHGRRNGGGGPYDEVRVTHTRYPFAHIVCELNGRWVDLARYLRAAGIMWKAPTPPLTMKHEDDATPPPSTDRGETVAPTPPLTMKHEDDATPTLSLSMKREETAPPTLTMKREESETGNGATRPPEHLRRRAVRETE